MGNESTETLTAYRAIPYNILANEINSDVRSGFEKELGEIVEFYKIYDKGADFTVEGTNGDYIASKLRHKQAKSLVNKEARFLFSNAPDIVIKALNVNSNSDSEVADIYQNLIDKVLKKNQFKSKLLRAAKDCFIGKRVALVMNFNPTSGISVSFIKSLEFYHEIDPDTGLLNKIVVFTKVVDSMSQEATRVFVKKYWMKEGYCYVQEDLYNGAGALVENITPESETLFEYIPAIVIVNDGLLGDNRGESEMENLGDYESYYSRLSNADIDAERKSMNPTKWAMDCSPESTSGLSTAAGAFWDLQSDENSASEKQGSVGILEPTMAYKDALKSTLDRIKNTMHEEIDVPNVSSEALQGVVTSGKTLKAIYWGLIVRCDEKMIVWEPALEFMVNTIIEGCILYPECLKLYGFNPFNLIDYEVEITNNYPLPEDIVEEKNMDITEVESCVMSKRAYMKKWRGLTDEEVDEELRQIALERQILEESSFAPEEGVEDEEVDEDTEDDDLDQNDSDFDAEIEGIMNDFMAQFNS